uniref:Phosphohydrolase n=1 Tax=Candidatus Methanomethylicus mesodigestus TaxID=1867258 RepID=A0A7C3FCI3_9CREN
MITEMERGEAIEIVRRHISKENNLKHMIAVGAIMKRLAEALGEDAKSWEIVGILHDVDFEECDGISDHTLKARDILGGIVSPDMIEAIMAHNYENTGVMPDTPLKKALIASDAVSGLIVAAALVMPSRKLSEVKPEGLMKKFKSKEFARGCSRERISVCKEIGFGVDQFLGIALDGMHTAAAELGL